MQPLKIFSATGTTEFLERNNTATASWHQAQLNGLLGLLKEEARCCLSISGGPHEHEAARPGFNGLVSMVQQGQCARLEPQERVSSLYDSPFMQLEMEKARPKQPAQKGTSQFMERLMILLRRHHRLQLWASASLLLPASRSNQAIWMHFAGRSSFCCGLKCWDSFCSQVD